MPDFASLGRYLREELKTYDNRFYRIPENTYWGAGGTIIPARSDMPLAAEEIVSMRQQYVGKAGVWDGKSNDIKLTNHVISTGKDLTVVFIDGAEWSMLDIERHRLASTRNITPNYSLVDAKVEACRMGLIRAIHETVLVGLPGTDFEGFFNKSEIALVDDSTTAVYSLTAANLELWFRGHLVPFKKSSKLSYSDIIVYVSDNLINALTESLGDNTGDSPYNRLTDPARGVYVQDIRSLSELDAETLEELGVYDTGDNLERMIMGAFGSEESVIRHYYPIDRTDPFDKNNTGVHWGITAWAGTSEVSVKIPENFQYVEYDATMS